MAPFRHIVISRNAPSRKALWLKPDEWTVYGHTPQGWRPLQASLFESVNSKMDKADKAVLDYVVNALKGKQDTLEAGSGISIIGNVISSTGGGPTEDSVEITAAEVDAMWDATE